MKYSKPPLTIKEQAQLLLSRGMESTESELIDILKQISYYRLSGYLFHFRIPDTDIFQKATTLEKIMKIYQMDAELRVLISEILSTIEISLKTATIYSYSQKHGAFAYMNRATLPKLRNEDYERFIIKCGREYEQNLEPFICHFKQKYGDIHRLPPLWILGEIMSFGTLTTIFRGIEPALKQEIAKNYKIPDAVLFSWIRCLNTMRNKCAHNSQLVFRPLGYDPFLPNTIKYPEWHTPVSFSNTSIFAVLTIGKYLHNVIKPDNQWVEKLISFEKEYHYLLHKYCGFPEQWKNISIWQ